MPDHEATHRPGARAVAFERHPAAIDRHAADEPSPPQLPGGIATWFPLAGPVHPVAGGAPACVDEAQLPSPTPGRAVFRTAEPQAPAPVRQAGPNDAVAEPSARSAQPVRPQEGVHPGPVADDDDAPVLPLPAPLPPARLLLRPKAKQVADLLWPGAQPQSFPHEDAPEHAPWANRSAVAAETSPAPDRRPFRRPLLQAAMVLAGIAVLGGLAASGVLLAPMVFGSANRVAAIFNAPMLVVRSSAGGRVATVAVNAGQLVEPRSQLLTIQGRDAASATQAVLAGVHGLIRSVETVPGADLVAGAALVRLHDCDRAFLTVPPGARLHAGERVEVKLPDAPPIPGIIRASAGIMEPPNALVVGLAPGTMATSCPVGASATVTRAVPG